MTSGYTLGDLERACFSRACQVHDPVREEEIPKAMPIVRRSPLLIVALALVPTLLYIVAGYGGEDFYFHAASWLELHQAWSHHEWTLAWGAVGTVRFW